MGEGLENGILIRLSVVKMGILEAERVGELPKRSESTTLHQILSHTLGRFMKAIAALK
jgi:hypothetical protein